MEKYEYSIILCEPCSGKGYITSHRVTDYHKGNMKSKSMNANVAWGLVDLKEKR